MMALKFCNLCVMVYEVGISFNDAFRMALGTDFDNKTTYSVHYESCTFR